MSKEHKGWAMVTLAALAYVAWHVIGATIVEVMTNAIRAAFGLGPTGPEEKH